MKTLFRTVLSPVQASQAPIRTLLFARKLLVPLLTLLHENAADSSSR